MSSQFILWDSDQGLWNKRLTGLIRKHIRIKIVSQFIVGGIVFLDTVILFISVLRRRVQRTSLSSIWRINYHLPHDVSLVYFDMGTHRNGQELHFMVTKLLPKVSPSWQAYGFEACKEFFDSVKSVFENNENVHINHKALCFPVPDSGKVKLFIAGVDGLGNSTFRNSSDAFEEVDAISFSDWFDEQGFDIKKTIFILRMNIEGSEISVLRDISKSGNAACISGYYGMWDDISKIDEGQAEEVHKMMKTHDIEKTTFNGRDFKFPLRLLAIRYDIVTSLINGLEKISKNNSI